MIEIGLTDGFDRIRVLWPTIPTYWLCASIVMTTFWSMVLFSDTATAIQLGCLEMRRRFKDLHPHALLKVTKKCAICEISHTYTNTQTHALFLPSLCSCVTPGFQGSKYLITISICFKPFAVDWGRNQTRDLSFLLSFSFQESLPFLLS